MLSGNNAAKWFIFHNPELASGYIDENTKVNKLLYFSNLLYYCVNGENLLSDEFVAFPNGPVIFSVYRDYRYKGLNLLPQHQPEIDPAQEQYLNIINFIYGNLSAKELVEESHTHSPWRDVSDQIPNNPKIEFSHADGGLVSYFNALYRTYADLDFSNIEKEKISGNIYFYYKDSFEMSDAVVERLSGFGKFDEPKFLEMIGGELVVS